MGTNLVIRRLELSVPSILPHNLQGGEGSWRLSSVTWPVISSIMPVEGAPVKTKGTDRVGRAPRLVRVLHLERVWKLRALSPDLALGFSIWMFICVL